MQKCLSEEIAKLCSQNNNFTSMSNQLENTPIRIFFCWVGSSAELHCLSTKIMCSRTLLIESFYGGSHKQLISFICELLDKHKAEYDLYTLPAKKWHWRARTSALYMSQAISTGTKYDVLFCSSVLNLAELIALKPELRDTKKIIYFHENQFVYPNQEEKERDFQYGYNTILSAMVADIVVFNSDYNMKTFLKNIKKHLKKQPDFYVSGLDSKIQPKCRVIYFPVTIPKHLKVTRQDSSILHIVWPHRWEHDKDPQLFFETLFKLKETSNFKVSVLGESFEGPLPIFEEAKDILKDSIIHYGRLQSKEEYFDCLLTAHVVVSTAKHEFFGVAMLEAVLCGCYPIAPADLVYPELYPPDCLYKTPQQLLKKLRAFCERPDLVEQSLQEFHILPENISSDSLAVEFYNLLLA